MSKEFLCRYLCIVDSCGWRLVTGGTKMPSQAEIKGDDYDPDLDWCIPALEAENYFVDPDKRVAAIIRQGKCDEYKSSEGHLPLRISFLPRA